MRSVFIFGEVLGKHSEISGIIDRSELKMITDNENVINVVKEYGLETGYNPFDEALCTYETEEVPENGVEWGNCMVQDFIDFKRKVSYQNITKKVIRNG